MNKKTNRETAGDVIRAVFYARVSSKEQEKEGFSIPAQLKLLKEYSAREGLSAVQEYVDVETAKQTGRTSFSEMVAFLRANPRVRAILVEKTDRLYRNLKDWVMLDELDVEIHLVKEGAILSRDSKSSEKFMHGIKVLMAKNYIDNLSEETRKGHAGEGRAGYLALGRAAGIPERGWGERQTGDRARSGCHATCDENVRVVCGGRTSVARRVEKGADGRFQLSQER